MLGGIYSWSCAQGSFPAGSGMPDMEPRSTTCKASILPIVLSCSGSLTGFLFVPELNSEGHLLRSWVLEITISLWFSLRPACPEYLINKFTPRVSLLGTFFTIPFLFHFLGISEQISMAFPTVSETLACNPIIMLKFLHWLFKHKSEEMYPISFGRTSQVWCPKLIQLILTWLKNWTSSNHILIWVGGWETLACSSKKTLAVVGIQIFTSFSNWKLGSVFVLIVVMEKAES